MVTTMRVCAEPGCGHLVLAKETRCREHGPHSPTYRARNASRAERKRRADTVAHHVAVFGWVCPGWQCEPHPSTDLTAAHVVAAARGGADGPLVTLCRSCNSRQGVE